MFGHLHAIFPWSKSFFHSSYFDAFVGFVIQFVKLANNKTQLVSTHQICNGKPNLIGTLPLMFRVQEQGVRQGLTKRLINRLSPSKFIKIINNINNRAINNKSMLVCKTLYYVNSPIIKNLLAKYDFYNNKKPQNRKIFKISCINT